jgi:hypothetical protein
MNIINCNHTKGYKLGKVHSQVVKNLLDQQRKFVDSMHQTLNLLTLFVNYNQKNKTKTKKIKIKIKIIVDKMY